ncbi:hypothetical protein NBRC116188_11050 [Oceaniserpentilla sp. 4NH20-0058]|uniref:adenylyltransferase/cytidyltransferase family protein n=1 Tax=Oceaniserpentilla sp. 4NH20-0058 TaxID=3127660 RepID=UPI00310A5DDE
MLTLKKFGYPETLIKSYNHWYLLLRPNQSTFASLILFSKGLDHNFSKLDQDAFTELKIITSEIEGILKHRFDYSKINYEMLMMVDPEVHFHVFPRYDSHTMFCNFEFNDVYWPKPVDVTHDLKLDKAIQDELIRVLRTDFNNKSTALHRKKYAKMYTSGCFDIFHQGHLNIIKKTKELCDYLVVGVSTDKLILESKGRLPLIPFEERVSILEANRYIDEVIPQVNKDKQSIVDMYNIDAISVGSDWFGKYPPVACDMVYFDYTPNVSSTVLKQKLND